MISAVFKKLDATTWFHNTGVINEEESLQISRKNAFEFFKLGV
jgi:hypothetical protein